MIIDGKQVKVVKDFELDIDKIDEEDKETLDAYRNGKCKDTFTFSSPGMTSTLEKIKLSKFEELIAVNALFRPGAMDYIDNYVRRKFGEEEVIYYLPGTEYILESTFGIICYQEQGIQIAKVMGFTGGEADNMRKALAKKNKAFLDATFPTFLEKAIKIYTEGRFKDLEFHKMFKYDENGKERTRLEQIKEAVNTYWDSLIGFSRYSFNFAHALAYAFLGYQTGYLKTHYMPEYFAAYFNHVSGDKTKLGTAIRHAKEFGIKILPPDLFKSEMDFTCLEDGTIVYGFSAIKGIGKSGEYIIEKRKHNEIKTIEDFVGLFSGRELNSRKMLSLAQSGALDCLCKNDDRIKTRSRLLFNWSDILDFCKPKKISKKQLSLFNLEENKLIVLDPTPQYKFNTLEMEKEVLGSHVSSSPLNYIPGDQTKEWENIKPVEGKKTQEMLDVKCGVQDIRERTTRSGKPYAYMTCYCETSHGEEITIEVTVWSDMFEKVKNHMPNCIGMFKLKLDDFRWKNFSNNEYKYVLVSADFVEN